MVIRGLTRRFGALELQTSVSCVINLLTFQRSPGESVDDALARFEMAKNRAEDTGQFQMGCGALAFLLLHQLDVAKVHWTVLLSQWNGGGSRLRDGALGSGGEDPQPLPPDGADAFRSEVDARCLARSRQQPARSRQQPQLVHRRRRP